MLYWRRILVTNYQQMKLTGSLTPAYTPLAQCSFDCFQQLANCTHATRNCRIISLLMIHVQVGMYIPRMRNTKQHVTMYVNATGSNVSNRKSPISICSEALVFPAIMTGMNKN